MNAKKVKRLDVCNPEGFFTTAVNTDFSAMTMLVKAQSNCVLPSGQPNPSSNPFPSLAAGIPQIALAAEQYLKSLAEFANGIPAIQTHDLVELFEDLPANYQHEVRGAFRWVFNGNPSCVVLRNADPHPEDWEFDAILKTNRNTFENWRYIAHNLAKLKPGLQNPHLVTHAVKLVILETQPKCVGVLDNIMRNQSEEDKKLMSLPGRRYMLPLKTA